MSWREHAACRGMALDCDGGEHPFYPQRRGVTTAHIKAVCAQCPVRLECLAAGMHEPEGIWGGLSVRERRAVRMGRRGTHVAATNGGRRPIEESRIA